MKKYIIIIVVSFFSLTSCVTQKSTTTAKDYWTQAPDLSNVTYEGGDGLTIENAIIILNAKNSHNGIASEYAYIGKIHGEKFTDWKPIGQEINIVDGRKIDSIKIQLLDSNETLTYYFDITEFYGKF